MVPVVAAALIDQDGQILMQQRRSGSAHGGLWEFPGGKIEPGESPESALVRELEEELGITIAADDLVAAHYAGAADGSLVILLYTCRVWTGTPCPLVSESLGWFALEDLAGLPMPPLDVPLAKVLGQFI